MSKSDQEFNPSILRYFFLQYLNILNSSAFELIAFTAKVGSNE